MSLVNEALRKARQEAARREAESRGSVPVAAPVHMPATPRRLVSPAVVVLAALLGLATLALVFLLARQSSPGPAPAVAAAPDGASSLSPESGGAVSRSTVSRTTPRDSAGTSANDSKQRARDSGGASPSSSDGGPRESGVTSSTSSGEGARESGGTSRESGGTPEVGPAAPRAAAPSPPPARPASPAPAPLRETYRKEAKLPDGTAIRLDFIVWSERNPFAQLNGQLLRPGEEVGELGYTVREVGREGVRLEGPAGSFFIRLR